MEFQQDETLRQHTTVNSIKSKDSVLGNQIESLNNTTNSLQFKQNTTLNQSSSNKPPKKKKFISMRDYITEYTKTNKIDLKFDNFPIHFFVDQPLNAAFINYKKRRLFKEVIQTVQTMKKHQQDIEKQRELERQMIEEQTLNEESAKLLYGCGDS